MADPKRLIVKLSTILKLVLIVSGTGAFVLVIGMAISPFFARQERLALSAVVVAGHAAVALGAAAASERGRLSRLMRIGMLLAFLGAISWLGVIWGGLRLSDRSIVYLVAMASTGLATLLMIVGVELSQPANGVAALAVRRTTVTLTVLLMPFWAFGAFGPIWDEPWLARGMASVGILIVCGLLANLMMARWHGLDREDESRGHVTVSCPRCGVGQRLRLGGDACVRCGLRITVHMP